MKTVPRICSCAVLSLLAAAVWVGCSNEGAPDTKVNVSAMTDALKSPDKDTKENACIELAKAKELAAPAVTALIALLKDSDPEVRRLAAYALGEIGPKAAPALSALKELMNDNDRQVLMQAINSLRAIDPKSAPADNMPNVQSP